MNTQTFYTIFCTLTKKDIELQRHVAFVVIEGAAYNDYCGADEASASEMITDKVLRAAFDSLCENPKFLECLESEDSASLKDFLFAADDRKDSEKLTFKSVLSLDSEDLTDEQREAFSEHFYEISEVTGDEDSEISCPWSCPWYGGSRTILKGASIVEMCEDYHERYKDEIAMYCEEDRLRKEEEEEEERKLHN